MASYIQGVSDQFNDTPRPQLNYTMLAQQQQTANTMFEQQVQSSKNDYSAALNMQVTGQAAEELKAGYITEAQKKLREVATQDLLLPKTAAQAQQVFEPFWSDERLLLNSGHTKNMSGSISKVQRGLMSTDDDERKMYDPSQLQYLQGTQLELERAGTDLNKLRAIRKRGIIPVRNIMDNLRAAAAEQKMTVEIDQPTGGYYLKSTIGGPDSVPNFTTFAAGILNDPSWKQQFEMYGQIDVDNRKRNLLAANPNLTDEELTVMVPGNIIESIDKMYTTQAGEVSSQLKTLLEQKQRIENSAVPEKRSNGVTEPVILKSQAGDYQAILRSIAMLENTQIGITRKQEQWNKDKITNKDYIYQNPAQYMGELQKQHSIQSFAAVMSASEKVTFKKDEAYEAFQDNVLEQQKEARLRRKDELDYQISLGTLEQTSIGNLIKAYDSGIIPKQAFKGVFGNMVNIGEDPSIPEYMKDDISTAETTNVLDIFNKQNEEDYMNLHNQVWAADGLAGYLIGKQGPAGEINTATINTVNTALWKKQNDSDYKYNAADKAALKSVADFLGVDNYEDGALLYTKLKGYVTTNASGVTNDQEYAALLGIDKIDADLKKINETKTALNKATEAVIKTDSKYAILKTKPEDIQDNFPSINLVTQDGTRKTLTGKEVASMWLKGEIDPMSTDVTIGNKQYKMETVTSPNGYSITRAEDPSFGWNFQRDRLTSLYGDPKTSSRLRREASNQVLKSMPNGLDALTGNRGKIATLTPTAPEAINIARGLSVPSGRNGMYSGIGRDIKPIDDPDEMLAVTTLLQTLAGTGKNTQLEYMSSVQPTTTRAPDGGPAVVFNFAPYKEGDKPVRIGDVDITDIVKKGSITIPINTSTDNPTLQNIIGADYKLRYYDMKQGASYAPTQGMQAAGFKVTIAPVISAGQGQASTVQLTGSYNYYNPKKGMYEQKPLIDPTTNRPYQFSFSQYTPEQINAARDRIYRQITQQNINNRKLANSGYQGTMTAEEYQREFKRTNQ
jgi:hypothetical protein